MGLSSFATPGESVTYFQVIQLSLGAPSVNSSSFNTQSNSGLPPGINFKQPDGKNINRRFIENILQNSYKSTLYNEKGIKSSNCSAAILFYNLIMVQFLINTCDILPLDEHLTSLLL